MAAAEDDFTWVPGIVSPKPLTKRYPILRSNTDEFIIQRQLLSSTPEELFELDFGEILGSSDPIGNNRDDIRAHYDAQIHDFYKFYYKYPPDYINSGSQFYVRYEEYNEIPIRYKSGLSIWKVKIIFRKEIT